jgi:hypothetical protein
LQDKISGNPQIVIIVIINYSRKTAATTTGPRIWAVPRGQFPVFSFQFSVPSFQFPVARGWQLCSPALALPHRRPVNQHVQQDHRRLGSDDYLGTEPITILTIKSATIIELIFFGG